MAGAIFLGAHAVGRVEGVPPDRPCGEQRGIGGGAPGMPGLRCSWRDSVGLRGGRIECEGAAAFEQERDGLGQSVL